MLSLVLSSEQTAQNLDIHEWHDSCDPTEDQSLVTAYDKCSTPRRFNTLHCHRYVKVEGGRTPSLLKHHWTVPDLVSPPGCPATTTCASWRMCMYNFLCALSTLNDVETQVERVLAAVAPLYWMPYPLRPRQAPLPERSRKCALLHHCCAVVEGRTGSWNER